MGKASRILVIDDDKDILDLLKYNLRKEGFSVKAVSDSSKAIATSIQFKPNLIILDLMMPQPNGIEVCRKLRSLDGFADTYIFFLTAKSEGYYREAAYETGGDDFIDKVIGLRALTHKVVTVLKQNFVIRKRENQVVYNNLVINRKSSTAVVEGKKIELSRAELELLFFLAQNPGKVITTEDLLNNIWGSEVFALSGTPDAYITNLIKKIGGNWIREVKKDKYLFKAG